MYEKYESGIRMSIQDLIGGFYIVTSDFWAEDTSKNLYDRFGFYKFEKGTIFMILYCTYDTVKEMWSYSILLPSGLPAQFYSRNWNSFQNARKL